MSQQQFASDNNAGLCPEALEALVRANGEGHTRGYGDDVWTKRAADRLRTLFETDCAVFFVFSGTAANALALAQLCRSYHAAIAHAESHVATDEAGATAFFSGGAALLTADTPLAKLTPAAVEALAAAGRGVHSVKPRALSLTQATEMGTVYSSEELVALTETARRHGLKVHMDGARLANAVAALACAPADLTWRAGCGRPSPRCRASKQWPRWKATACSPVSPAARPSGCGRRAGASIPGATASA
jgi:threonine aldolase